MIQRKQTVYLLVAVIAYLVCLFMPIAHVTPDTMGAVTEVFNLGVVDANGTIQVEGTCFPLFLLLSVSTVLSVVTIFLYKNRKLQMTLCSIALLFNVLWYVDFALLAFQVIALPEVAGKFSMEIRAILPLVSFVLVLMAKKSIKADEDLIKAADRIR